MSSLWCTGKCKGKEHGGDLEKKWNSILRYYETKYKDETKDFKVLLDGGLPSGWEASLPKWSTSDPVDATRGYSERCLNALVKVLPGLIGGSADLASLSQRVR